MGFLKKKWQKLLSKRKSKVNVVSIMRLVLIVKLGHNSIPNSVWVFVPSPFSISSHSATVHTPMLVRVGSVKHSSCNRAMPMLLPFSISHIFLPKQCHISYSNNSSIVWLLCSPASQFVIGIWNWTFLFQKMRSGLKDIGKDCMYCTYCCWGPWWVIFLRAMTAAIR